MDDAQRRRQAWLICLGLALGILAAYASLWHAGFIEFDDPVYVTANSNIQDGLSWKGFVWSFTTRHAGIWHPLTWLSYLMDFQLYGMNPRGFHFTNVLLHIANSILLFLLLDRLTEAPLDTVFDSLSPPRAGRGLGRGVLAEKTSASSPRPSPPSGEEKENARTVARCASMTASRWASALTAALFALHPMHVESVAWISERKDVLSTLFWILSAWAYTRWVEESRLGKSKGKKIYIMSVFLFALGLMAKPMLVTLPFILLLLDWWPLQRREVSAVRLLAEKTPYFILAAAFCLVTFVVARGAEAIESVDNLPWASRLENIPVSYARYIAKAFWPADLAVMYPYQLHWPLWEIVGATGLLVMITVWVLWRVFSRPYCAVGWFWFLIMLAPVIGVVRVGSFSMADRYSYLSSTGLFIMIIWAMRSRPRALCVVGIPALAACLTGTAIQVRYWTDSETLFRHALAVTNRNPIMENTLGKVLLDKGHVDEALPHLQRAVAFAPNYPQSHFNLAKALLAKGQVAEALAQFQINVTLQPNDAIPQYVFGSVLLDQGLAADAIPHLEKAVQLHSDAAEGHYKLAEACRQAGRAAEAIEQYETTLKIQPGEVQAESSLAWMLATTPNASLRNGARAVQLAQLADQAAGSRDPKILGVLAAAYAETGDFSRASDAVTRALQLPGVAHDSPLAGVLRAQLALYRERLPFRDAVK